MDSHEYVFCASKEPLDERVEVGWKISLDRFENVIYPELFAPRGYTKSEAHMLWAITSLSDDIHELQSTMKDGGFGG